MDDRLGRKPDDVGESRIEKLLKVVPLASDSDNLFTNASPLWHPPGAQGIYGGICIAQSLNAAQATVPVAFAVHSMHGQFLLAGRADDKLVYRVCRASDGRSFATRKVDVIQKGEAIFTAMIGFARETTPTAERKHIQHSEPMPRDIPRPADELGLEEEDLGYSGAFVNKKVGMINLDSNHVHEKRVHQWGRTRYRMSPSAGVHAHLAALAYISDCYFIGTIPHVHKIWDFVKPPQTEFDAGGPDLSQQSSRHSRIPASDEETDQTPETPRIGMMVTLNHTMFFHAPRAVKADEWMLSELASHWAGHGRGVATQKIWSKDSTLIATCIQEGVVRLADKGLHHGPGERSTSRL
ncbi:acyl-CoA thioesterase [Exophiala xenobiotica]|jgi:acyl-coenzyme A thioesterase 1/2/4